MKKVIQTQIQLKIQTQNILKKLPAYSDTAPKTNIMQERSQMPMEVIPGKVVKVKNLLFSSSRIKKKALFLRSKLGNGTPITHLMIFICTHLK